MRILAIETVELTGSVALLEGDRVVAEHALDPASRSAQSLAPGIARLFGESGWQASDVELVAVASGPGSFTGLRIGVTTAKMFAYATGCQVIGVNTMAAVAARVPDTIARLSVVLDAQRNELFVAEFSRDPDGKLSGEETTRLLAAERWLDELPPGTVVTGPGLTKWSKRVGSQTIFVEPTLWPPVASAVGRVGLQALAAGRRITAAELVPQYYRRTAAEEKAESKTTKDER